MSLALGHKVFFGTTEAADFDSVFTWFSEGDQHFAPVQMKELVPEQTNAGATLQVIISGLKKYTDSKNLVVAIKLNRALKIEFSALDFSSVTVGEIWCFGATTKDESEWVLVDNLLAKAGCQQYNLKWSYA
jgi:hypothetical protein